MNRRFVASAVIGLIVLLGAGVYAASRPTADGRPCLLCRVIAKVSH
jgi:hypothetical protein